MHARTHEHPRQTFNPHNTTTIKPAHKPNIVCGAFLNSPIFCDVFLYSLPLVKKPKEYRQGLRLGHALGAHGARTAPRVFPVSLWPRRVVGREFTFLSLVRRKKWAKLVETDIEQNGLAPRLARLS